MKKKITALLLVVALVAVSIAGATMAYFTDTDQAVNVATVGNVKIEQIEQERDANGNLQPFTQNKPLYPYVGEIAWNDAKININGHDYSMFGEKLKNALDKIVTVKNTGKSDAYVRTWIALEDPFTVGLLGVNVGGVGYTQTPWFTADINGVQYSVTCFTYDEALEPGESSLPSLLQVYLKSIATNEDAALLGDTYEILAFSQAVQTAGFANAEEALKEAFGTDHPWTAATQGNAGNNTELKDALTSNATTIIVNLTEDVTYDVAAWANDAMGGEKTELIVINGNGHTLTFNQTNSDWNNIVTNGAKLVINNAHITSSGYNDGPWNRHDLNFACEVELNNVTSDKALALKSGATLNHVVIDDANTSDTYAIWIQPNGQTVTLNNVLIDMVDCTDGRGIKIDEQYVSEPKHVTLNVSNTTFKTEEKSAILVKSAAGATINLDNVDIYGVEGDPVNAVWVDEASADYADLVIVNGGTKIVENDDFVPAVVVDTADELIEALESGKDVVMIDDVKINPAGMSNAYGTTGINVKNGQTIDGNGNTLDIKGAGGTWDSGINTTGGLIKDLTVTGSFRGIFINHNSTHSERVVLENVTIDGTTYTISCDQGMNQGLTATNSTFNGWTSYAATLGDAKFVDCNFGYGNGYRFMRPYAPTEFVGCNFEAGFTVDPRAAVTFENCYLDGVLITADNVEELVTSTTNVTVK